MTKENVNLILIDSGYYTKEQVYGEASEKISGFSASSFAAKIT